MSQASSGRGKGTAVAIAVIGVLALVVIVLIASAAGGSNGDYTVRAIFDDASNIIPGEDVKIDGVKVGSVGEVVPTPAAKAAVTLNIENPGFQNFRADASCTIEPEALIGEKFVNCLPTQPRPEGAPLPAPLHRIEHGEGAGQYLLPVTNTSSPVGVDQLEDINRLPVSQRFTIIINELGTGLAGRGSDLNEVIKRADPALREFDKWLGILASQNKLLTNLAEESSRALAPIPGVKDQIAGFIGGADTVAHASANHSGAIAQNLAALPPFLRELGPAMERYGRLAEQTIPTFTDLRAAAPSINQQFASTPAFANSTTAFFQSLGKSAKTSGPALVALQPLLGQLKNLGGALKPFSGNLSELLLSLRNTGGLERILDFIFLSTGASNGYDALGHFLRAEGLADATCLAYHIKPVSGCGAKLFNTNGLSSSESGESGSAAKASSSESADLASAEQAAGTSVLMARTLAVLHGATPAQAIAKYPGSTTTGPAANEPLDAGSGLVGTGLGFGGVAGEGSTGAQPVGGSSAGTTYYTPSSEGSQAGGMLLNYLLGG